MVRHDFCGAPGANVRETQDSGNNFARLRLGKLHLSVVSRVRLCEHEIDNMRLTLFILLLYGWSPPHAARAQDYVPLNSLTISSLYTDNEAAAAAADKTSTEKPWWTDLQEQREMYKATKKREQNMKVNNGKIIPMKQVQPVTTRSTNEIASELPRPMIAKQGTETKPDIPFPQGKPPRQMAMANTKIAVLS